MAASGRSAFASADEASASADDGNLASARTLARLGFREHGHALRPGGLLRLFHRPLP